MLSWFKKLFRRGDTLERRSSGFTSLMIAERAAYVTGRSGLAELTATAQACISLWEQGLSLADVDGTDLLTRRDMAILGRSLALSGEALFLVREDRLVPCADWALSTRDARPVAYRVSIAEASGGTTQVALASEVLHVRIGADPAAPWLGTPPLRRASLTAGLLQALEAALAEIYENAPLGSQIVPYPESQETDMSELGRSFRGQRGRVLLRESVAVTAAGGPMPQTDWRPADVTPDLSRAMARESWLAARDCIAMAFGVLPALFDGANMQGPTIRETQRHLAQWTLQPVAALLAEEARDKLGAAIAIDVIRPTQSWDAGGRARALAAIVEALARAKEAGLAPGDLAGALRLVDWET